MVEAAHGRQRLVGAVGECCGVCHRARDTVADCRCVVVEYEMECIGGIVRCDGDCRRRHGEARCARGERYARCRPAREVVARRRRLRQCNGIAERDCRTCRIRMLDCAVCMRCGCRSAARAELDGQRKRITFPLGIQRKRLACAARRRVPAVDRCRRNTCALGKARARAVRLGIPAHELPAGSRRCIARDRIGAVVCLPGLGRGHSCYGVGTCVRIVRNAERIRCPVRRQRDVAELACRYGGYCRGVAELVGAPVVFRVCGVGRLGRRPPGERVARAGRIGDGQRAVIGIGATVCGRRCAGKRAAGQNIRHLIVACTPLRRQRNIAARRTGEILEVHCARLAVLAIRRGGDGRCRTGGTAVLRRAVVGVGAAELPAREGVTRPGGRRHGECTAVERLRSHGGCRRAAVGVHGDGIGVRRPLCRQRDFAGLALGDGAAQVRCTPAACTCVRLPAAERVARSAVGG